MTNSDATKVQFNGECFSVDAELVAEGFGITSALLQSLARQARITSRHERGMDQDAGRHRLTFFHGARRVSLIVDEAGNIIERRSDRVARAQPADVTLPRSA